VSVSCVAWKQLGLVVVAQRTCKVEHTRPHLSFVGRRWPSRVSGDSL